MSFQNRMCCGRREGGKCLVAKEHDRELGDVTQFLAWYHFSVRCGSAEWVFVSAGGWILSILAGVFRRGQGNCCCGGTQLASLCSHPSV